MRSVRSTFLALLLTCAGSAQAAPVTTDIELGIRIEGLDSITTLQVTFTNQVVDVTDGTVTLPAATLTGLGLVVPVTVTTSLDNLNVSTLGIQGGTFSVGGITNQLSFEVCRVRVFPGSACNVGGGIGGIMGLTGTVDVSIVPMIVVIPLDLNQLSVGQGLGTNSPFTNEAAGWTTGTGLVNTGTATRSTIGAGAGPLVLVSPTYLDALGFLLPIFATLVVTNTSVVVPEASGLALLLAGAVGLATLGFGGRSR